MTMEELKQVYVCEYSAAQGCFHVETLQKALEENTFIILNNRKVDYIPFWIGSTWDEACKVCDAMKAELYKRRKEDTK